MILFVVSLFLRDSARPISLFHAVFSFETGKERPEREKLLSDMATVESFFGMSPRQRNNEKTGFRIYNPDKSERGEGREREEK